MLLTDTHARVLVVKPAYRAGWLLPGGTVEPGEAPREAAEREVREELGLRKAASLAGVAWHPPSGPVTEAVVFLFRAEPLTDAEISTITLAVGELESFRFVPPAELAEYLLPGTASWSLSCLEHPETVSYFEWAAPSERSAEADDRS